MALETRTAERNPLSDRRGPEPDAKHRWRTALREVGFIFIAALSYSLVRGLTDNRVDAAFSNAERVISWETSIGAFAEPGLQESFLAYDAGPHVANAIYIWGYWPVLAGTLIWLIVRHQAAYPLYRNALLVSGALSLVIFALFPLAPPRFLPEHGFVDTVAQHSSGYREVTASALVNEYAAMPSLHFGWMLLVGIAWVAVSRHAALRIAGAVVPALMFAAIVLTGNHYILDGLVGGAVVLAGLVGAHMLRRVQGRGHAIRQAVSKLVTPAVVSGNVQRHGAPEARSSASA